MVLNFKDQFESAYSTWFILRVCILKKLHILRVKIYICTKYKNIQMIFEKIIKEKLRMYL